MAKLAILGGEKVSPNGPQYRWPEYGDEEKAALERALNKSSWCRIMLPAEDSELAAFENEWARFLGRRYCVTVANGTIALYCGLWALGVGPGDEVIVPALTFLATATAVSLCHATPVFVDSDPNTYQIDPEAVEAAISPRTRAIVPVHYGGYPCDMDRLKLISEKHGIPVLEDCAHAHGSEWKGQKVGGLITLGAYSFQHGKSLTSGEGGAVVTEDEELFRSVASFHNVGRVPGGDGSVGQVMSGNFRLSEFCGAVLRGQLKRLPEQNKRRKENCDWLSAKLREIGGLEPLPEDPRITARGYYYYILRYDPKCFGGVSRDVFLRAMQAEGISCVAGYGAPVYKLPAYDDSPHRVTDCSQAERICATEQVTLWNHLLLNKQNLEDFARAVQKLKENLDELRTATK